MARDPTPFSHNTSLQAPLAQSQQCLGNCGGYFKVVSMSLSLPPPSNKQSDRKTNMPVAWTVLTERQIPPSPTPRLFPTKFLQIGPCFCSSPPKGITLLSILKAVSPNCFFCFPECTDRTLQRLGWGPGWPGESQHFLAEPSILAIWVRDPKWTVLFCCRVIVASVGGPPRNTQFQPLQRRKHYKEWEELLQDIRGPEGEGPSGCARPTWGWGTCRDRLV